MVETVASKRSRRLPFWAILVALVVCVLGGVFVLLWIKLPTWAPEWVVAHSPWAEPIVRVAEEAQARSSSPRIVNQARQRLLDLGDDAKLALLHALNAKSRKMRQFSLGLLLERGDEQLSGPLVALLKREARELAAQARKSGGASFIAENRDRFDPMFDALLKQPPAQVTTVIMPLPGGNDLEAAVIFELAGKIADARLVPVLAEIVQEGGGSCDELVGPVFGGRTMMATDALLNSPEPGAIPAILPLFEATAVEGRRLVVSAVRGLFGQIPPDLVQPLCRRLTDSDADVRQTAAKAMVFVDVPAVEAELIRLSHSEDVGDRKAAVFGLGSRYSNQSGIARLSECLFNDSDDAVRRDAVESLAKTKEELGVPVLVQALKTASPLIRREACFALCRSNAVREPATQEALLAAMDDTDDATSECAEKTLSRLSLETDLKQRVNATIERLKPRREQRARVREER